MTIRKIEHTNHTVYGLPNGTTLGMPHSPNPDGALTNLVTNALNHTLLVANQAHEAAQDPDLSDAGRAKKVMGPLRDATKRIVEAHNAASKAEVDAATIEAELFAVPRLEPGDAVSALEDRELRDWVRGLSPEMRTKVLQEINDGAQIRVRDALLRNPIPGARETEIAMNAFRASVEKAQPLKVQHIAQLRDEAEWAKATLVGFASHVARMAGSNVDPVLEGLAGESPDMARLFGEQVFAARIRAGHLKAA